MFLFNRRLTALGLLGLISGTLTLASEFNRNPAVAQTAPQQSIDRIFPANSGIVNIKTEYGAKGDGVTDDTQAILKAIRENIGYKGARKVIYFPKGTYLVSDRLVWKNASDIWDTYLTFQGENRDQTIIKLKDNAPGYNDPQNPRAVIYTASKNGSANGGGGQAHRNFIFDLTVDTGSGNPGAVGIDYHANNLGSIRRVTIRSGDGAGTTGLRMSRGWPGPCLIKNVKVVGFDIGIESVSPEYSITFEHIELENQRVLGIRNQWNILNIRGLTSRNRVPVIKNDNTTSIGSRDNRGLIVLVDANFSGGDSTNVAIDNFAGRMYLRNISTSGYAAALRNKGTVLPGAAISEYLSDGAYSLFGSSATSLKLPIAETPSFEDNNLNNWVNVRDFGATPNDGSNDTAAIQKAIDSTINSPKTTLYFPTGFYRINQTLILRGNVRKIVGMQSRLESYDNSYFSDANNPRPFLQIGDGPVNPVIIESLNTGGGIGTNEGAIGIQQATARTLVIQDSSLGGAFAYRNIRGWGKLFLEDVVGKRFRFNGPLQVWARQLNTEVHDLKIRNYGSQLWILGLKTENFANSASSALPPTVIRTSNGGSTELLGGLIYPAEDVPASVPAFINEDSKVSLIYAVSAYGSLNRNHQIHVQETRRGVTRNLYKNQFLGRDVYGSSMPLYVGND
ncbi:MAG: glycoside hydrolase family 55 protein [Cyanosarcina radialis HA8281-LM2]|jgi:hypothetical protein|nr:glycoside hydrolase family 55 protein [Cyanosarcina radialis HA8281-LM2]